MLATTEREMMTWLRLMPTNELEELQQYQKHMIREHTIEIEHRTEQKVRLMTTHDLIQRVISERVDGA